MSESLIDDLFQDAKAAGVSPAEYVYTKIAATSFALVTEGRVTDPVVETYQWVERLVAALIEGAESAALDWEALQEVNIRLAREVLAAEANRDLLWGKAQRIMNRSNSANDTWVEVPQSCLDEMGEALLRTSGPYR